MMTLVHQSGSWNRYSEAGLLHRDLFCTPVYVANDVAFMCRHPKLTKYYADHHDVDEDARTIPSLGEHWCGVTYAGLHCRHIDWYPYVLNPHVASSTVKIF